MVATTIDAIATHEVHSVHWHTAGPILWERLHRWAMETACPSGAGAYLGDFELQIGCGECRAHWRQWVEENPPDGTSNETLFEWTVSAHNEVNRRLGRAKITLDDAEQRWGADRELIALPEMPLRPRRLKALNCEHAIARPSPVHVTCGVGRFGGTPHIAVCKDCPDRSPKEFSDEPVQITDDVVASLQPRDPLSREALRTYFDRVVVLNLRRRPDRLAGFNAMLAQIDWPFRVPERFDAIDGSKVPTPAGWQSGGGAWGCMQSHRQVLERAIMDGVGSLLVLEDDACCRSDFADDVAKFLANVPDDWEQLMLGGQHIGNDGVPAGPGVVRCLNCQRTHAYAVRGTYLKDLYALWCAPSAAVHCDHLMGPFQRSRKVYAPDPFLFGQERTKSDINGALNPRKFWQPPTPEMPVILLHAPREVAEQVRENGFHLGFDRDPITGIDSGLRDIYAHDRPAGERVSRLKHWIEELNWESASYDDTFTTIWHPSARLADVAAAARGPVHEIHAVSADEAIRALPSGAGVRSGNVRSAIIVCLKAPPDVVRELRELGWHTGYWRDEESDIDRGLLDIFRELRTEEELIDRLRPWIFELQVEAETIPGGVLAIWHPRACLALVSCATVLPVIEINASTTAEACEALRAAKAGGARSTLSCKETQ